MSAVWDQIGTLGRSAGGVAVATLLFLALAALTRSLMLPNPTTTTNPPNRAAAVMDDAPAKTDAATDAADSIDRPRTTTETLAEAETAAPGSIRSLFSWKRLSTSLAISVLLWLVTLTAIATFQRRLVFPGQMVFRNVNLDVASTGWDTRRLRDVEFKTDDGLTLKGWLALTEPTESELPAAAAGRPLAIYFGGNAGTRRMRLGSIDLLNEIGLNVLIVDYRSFAGNPGRPSEKAFLRDGIAMVKRFQSQWSLDDDQIVLVGESLGGAVATAVAADRCDDGHPPAALILKATFASMTETAGHHYPFLPVGLMLIDRFPTVDRIGRVTCPLLQFHGEKDIVVPPAHGRRLFDAAPAKSRTGVAKRLVSLPQSGHNDMQYVAADDLERETAAFLRTIGVLPAGSE